MATTVNGTPIMEAKLSDLLEPSKALLKNFGLGSLLQRQYFTTDGEDAFFVETDGSWPIRHFDVLFPELDKEEMLVEGWKHLHFSIELGLKSVGLIIEGFYEKEGVPVDVSLRLVQGSQGYQEDAVVLRDRRIPGHQERTSFKEIMEARLKSGDLKYAGPDDVYGEMEPQRIVKVFNRFMRDWTKRHKFIEKD